MRGRGLAHQLGNARVRSEAASGDVLEENGDVLGSPPVPTSVAVSVSGSVGRVVRLTGMAANAPEGAVFRESGECAG